MRPLKVMMVSTSYPVAEGDWRARFIYDMVLSLSKRSDVQLRLWAPPGPCPAGVQIVATTAESEWLHMLQERGGAAQVYKNGGISRFSTVLQLMHFLRKAYRRNADVDLFHVNWLQNALPLFGTDTPVLATCLGADLALMENSAIARAVGMTLRQRPFVIAPNAEWMREKLQRTTGCDTPVVPIYFGVNTRWFELNEVRRVQSPRQWLVVSRLTKRKLGFLLDWGKQFVTDGDQLHLLGPMQEQLELPDWIHYHGPTNPDDLAKRWFPRATALVTLSQHSEGLPQVILEAMAAGIPVIATRIPGHEAALLHGQTGWLVGNEQQLADAIAALRSMDRNMEVGLRAHQWVRDNVGTWADCAERFVQNYQLLLSQRKRT